MGCIQNRNILQEFISLTNKDDIKGFKKLMRYKKFDINHIYTYNLTTGNNNITHQVSYLDIAIESYAKRIIKCLVENNNTSINQISFYNILKIPKLVKYFVKHIDFSYRIEKDKIEAYRILLKHDESFQILLKHIDFTNDIMLLAMFYDKPHIFEYCINELKMNIDENIESVNMNILHSAVHFGYTDYALYLIDCGADITNKNLYLEAKKRNKELADVILFHYRKLVSEEITNVFHGEMLFYEPGLSDIIASFMEP